MKLTIRGLHCKSCKTIIEDILEDLNTEILFFGFDASLKLASLEVATSKTKQEIKEAIEAEGYTVG